MTIEYDGTEFSGWQVQPDRRTVQGELYRAFHQLAGKGVKITGAGRTDAGVHAVGQVASVRLDSPRSEKVLLKALNAILPADILVSSLEQVDEGFNARFDAVSRSYRYIFTRKRTALWNRYYHFVEADLDIDAMRSALCKLAGRKDFTSFASTGDHRSTFCTVKKAEISYLHPLLTISITADRFLYKMVRTLAGTVLEIGRGSDIDIEDLLAARDRRAVGRTLPPHALYLMRVDY